MRHICPIGTPKAASVLIQNSLEIHPDRLAKCGIVYGKLRAPDANHPPVFRLRQPGPAQHVMRHRGPANAWLKKTLIPDLEDPFSFGLPDHPEKDNPRQFSLQEFADMTGRLLSRIGTLQ